MYHPIIFNLNNEESNMFVSSNNEVILSSHINLPLLTLGFQYFLHRTKSSMGITKNLETKNEFYYVINPFEFKISNYEDSLDKLTNYYFNIQSENLEIKNQNFYKFWEILLFFEVGDMDKIVYTTLNDTSGSFIQAIINYRQKMNFELQNDKIFSVAINQEKPLELSKQFLGFYKKNYPNLLNIHKTMNIKQKLELYGGGVDSDINSSENQTDDIKIGGGKKPKEYNSKKSNSSTIYMNSIKSIEKTIHENNEYSNLITANGNLNLDIDENFEEQKSYQLILGEIITALKIQAHNGHFILKIFETFTIPSLKLIYILTYFYKDMYIYKPYFSRMSLSEKYLICKNFKYDWKKDNTILTQKIKNLEQCLRNMDSSKYVYDIFPDMILPSSFLNKFKFINIKLANMQQIMINEIIKYIKENNYFGDKYHEYREKQIEASKWWINTFFPPSANLYKKNKEDLSKLLLLTIEKYNIEIQNLSANLIK